MKKIGPNDPETRSADLVARNIEQLKRLFPEAVTEGKVDFTVLRQLLGDAVDESPEQYDYVAYESNVERQFAEDLARTEGVNH